MSSGRNDIRLIELKDTISQLNQTIRVQTEMIKDLRKAIEEHHASDEKKDQIISNLQAEISYLKAKLFGASSEKRRKEDLPGQMSLFDELMEEEPAKEIEPEYIEIKAHERKRKKKPDLSIACSTCDLSEVHERNATVPAGKRLGTAGSNDHESFHGKMDHSLFQNILSANV